MNGISGRGDAIADRVHGEAEVGTEIIVALDGPTTPYLGQGDAGAVEVFHVPRADRDHHTDCGSMLLHRCGGCRTRNEWLRLAMG